MNSTSLAVRSISVDFMLSLLGSAFDLLGNVDDILLTFMTILPEVVGREIGLYSVDGHVNSAEDLERSIWPMRRSFADLEDANPLDDDRIDPELSPILKHVCRASQAVLDGVLVELRLKKDKCKVVGTQIRPAPKESVAFDADEESLVEAANFFLPETGPLQRIRWLRTLKSLHESKGQWLEAAEALMDCANTISDAIPHLDNIWRPSTFQLWSDARRSTWIETIGQELGHPDRGNAGKQAFSCCHHLFSPIIPYSFVLTWCFHPPLAVMAFSNELLEPSSLMDPKNGSTREKTIQKPTMAAMCTMLTTVTKEAVQLYLREGGMEELAYSRLESLLKILMGVVGDQGSLRMENRRHGRFVSVESKKRLIENEALLRRATATLSALLVSLLVQEETAGETDAVQLPTCAGKAPFYLLVTISGTKPTRFQESTTLPTFLDWNSPSVCRVSNNIIDLAKKKHGDNVGSMKKQICLEFGQALKAALERDMPAGSVQLCTDFDTSDSRTRDPAKTYLDITVLHTDLEMMMMECRSQRHSSSRVETKSFFYRKPEPVPSHLQESGGVAGLVEVTVAHSFPSILSRQRALLTSEIRGI
jgi:hypothetical protein